MTEIENRQKAIEEICSRHVSLANAGTADIDRAIKALEEVPLTEDKWKESLEEAITAVKCETNALKLLRDAAAKKEEDTRRLAELEAKQAEAERIIREQKIREEAERKAKEEAEARAAAEKARLEREKEMAERRAAEAEMARKEAEERARNVPNPVQAAVVGAQQAVTPMSKTLPTPKPSKWTPEMKAVNKSILDTFSTTIEAEVKKVIVGFTESGYKVAAENTAKALVSAIIKGEIKNLKVEY